MGLGDTDASGKLVTGRLLKHVLNMRVCAVHVGRWDLPKNELHVYSACGQAKVGLQFTVVRMGNDTIIYKE